MIFFDDLKSIKRNNKEEYKLFSLLGLIWGNITVGFVFIFAFKLLGVNTEYKSIATVLLYSILVVNAFPTLSKRLKWSDVFVVVTLWLVYISHIFLYPENQDKILEYLPIFSTVILYYFLGRASDNKNVFVFIRIASIANILCSAFYYLVFSQRAGYAGTAEADAENMEAAYQLLPSVLFMLQSVINNQSWKLHKKLENVLEVAFSFIGMILIASMGSRGPLVCIIFLLLCNSLLSSNIKIHQKIFITIFLGVIYLNLNYIVLAMLPISEMLGMSTRVFDLFLEGTFFGGEVSSDIRTYIVKVLMERMDGSSAIWGYGITGSWHVIQNYPHNFYVDIVYSFGYLLGGIMLLLLLWLSIKAYVASNQSEKSLMFVLFSCSIIKLFMSSTYLQEPYLYMYIGFCVSVIKLNRNRILTL